MKYLTDQYTEEDKLKIFKAVEIAKDYGISEEEVDNAYVHAYESLWEGIENLDRMQISDPSYLRIEVDKWNIDFDEVEDLQNDPSLLGNEKLTHFQWTGNRWLHVSPVQAHIPEPFS